jgi:chemotaxis protein MotA
MLYLGGLLFAIGCIIAAMKHLGQSVTMLWDYVAFFVVFGGTAAVGAITLPWRDWPMLKHLAKTLMVSKTSRRKEYLQHSLDFVSGAGGGGNLNLPSSKSLPLQVLRDGAELMNLGFQKSIIEEVLTERVYHYGEQGRRIANKVRSLSKYPPAFGLAGTVLGLIHLMGGISSGMSPRETGVRMAVALLATFYGLIVANLFVNPLGERIQEIVDQEAMLAEVGVRAVALASEGVHRLEAQEILNSFVHRDDRIDALGSFDESAGEAAA